MAKPAVTLRSATAPTPLTFQQLDDNFTNLRDATVTLTAGTGGTAVTADLNGTITLVAGTNITLTGNNTAKTITIDSVGGNTLDTDDIEIGQADGDLVTLRANDATNSKNLRFSARRNTGSVGEIDLTDKVELFRGGWQFNSTGLLSTPANVNIDAGTTATLAGAASSVYITNTDISISSNGTVTVVGNPVELQNSAGTTRVNFNLTGATALLSTPSGGIDIASYVSGQQRALIQLSSGGQGISVVCGATGSTGGKLSITSRLWLNSLTTTQRDNLTNVADGDMIYNSTLQKFQGRAGGAWVDLH
jgi:hypothetical protein